MGRILGIVSMLVVAGGVSFQLPANSQRQSASDQAVTSRFVGTWRLVSAQTDGKPNPNRGAHPAGLIYYDATGHMAAQIAPERSRPSWPANGVPTPDQAKEAVTGYTAYFGTYSIDDTAKTVTHHREGALNMYAVDLVRRYEFTANGQLVLIPVDNPSNQLMWERIR